MLSIHLLFFSPLFITLNYCVCTGHTNTVLSGHRVFCFPDKQKEQRKKRNRLMWFVQVKRRDFTVTSATKRRGLPCDAHFKHPVRCACILNIFLLKRQEVKISWQQGMWQLRRAAKSFMYCHKSSDSSCWSPLTARNAPRVCFQLPRH